MNVSDFKRVLTIIMYINKKYINYSQIKKILETNNKRRDLVGKTFALVVGSNYLFS